MENLTDQIPKVKERIAEIDSQASQNAVIQNKAQYKKLMTERAHLEELSQTLDEIEGLYKALEEAKSLLAADPEMATLAQEEITSIEERIPLVEKHARVLLVPPDPLDGKNIIVEIRSGTGGEEASLFARDLFEMYSRYAATHQWKLELMGLSEASLGGIKEVSFSLSGKNVYGSMKYESGTHRVQRVPETEASGRIHTSAATVAILPEAEETEIVINPDDLRIDVMRAGGPGGQYVNKTESAVRITHIPTGIVVIQQDEKSQIKNREKAMRILRARLFDYEEEKKRKERAETRKNQVGSGDRSERIRTYNFPQNRLTDHRIGLTLYKLDAIIQGDLDELFEALKIADGEKAIADAGKTL